MEIYNVTDSEFIQYGKVLDLDTDEIVSVAKNIKMPQSGSVYVPSEKTFEKLKISKEINNYCFGQIPTQTGYCYGFNDTLNALEWHKTSEINIAVTDLILLLGHVWDIKDEKYNSENVKAFKLHKGESIEVYATTLHFCPIQTNTDGFGCVVALPTETNTELNDKAEEKFLFRKNKWLIAHDNNETLINRGVTPGIYGPNYKL